MFRILQWENYIVYKTKHLEKESLKKILKAFTLKMTLEKVVWKQIFQINF